MTRITLARIGKNQTVRYAVEELYTYFKKMDPQLCVDVRVYPKFVDNLSDVIWVGSSEAFAALLPAVEDKEKDDSICIDISNNAGIITGSNPRAVLIAAYRFLKELGVSWIRPTDDGEMVPQYTISSLNVHVQEKASCRHRVICIEGSASYEHVLNMLKWIPRAGMNGYEFQFMRPYHFFRNWYEHTDNPYLPSEPVTREDVDGMVEQLTEEIEKRGLMLHKVGHGWTCEPFGIPSDGWHTAGDNEISEKLLTYLAQIDGQRKFFQDMPVFTNLCYSNPEVRELIAEAAADYCAANPNVGYLHFYLADASNNNCECDRCTERPSDYLVMMLNRIDEKLTERNLDTTVAFPVFSDTLWRPLTETLHNPQRFLMMFAPIMRGYDHSYDGLDLSEDYPEPPFEKNQVDLPRSMEGNYTFLRSWQGLEHDDSVVFDYHLMWAHLCDPGYYAISEVLFRDMQALHKIDLNGMISCQLTRCAFPTNLPMQMMADALWDENCNFGEKCGRYFAEAFGADGEAVKEYIKTVSVQMEPGYSKGYFSKEDRSPYGPEERLARMYSLKAATEKFGAVIQANLKKPLPDAQHKSWDYLLEHKHYISCLVEIVVADLTASAEDRNVKINDLKNWLMRKESELHKVLDVRMACNMTDRIYKTKHQAALHE